MPADLSSKVEQLVSSLESKFPVELTLFFRKGSDYAPAALKIDGIFLPKDKRSLGIGSQVMEEVVSFMDEHSLIGLLTPSTDFGATSVNRLRKFYGRFGFTRNFGGKKDFRFSEAMIRQPRTQARSVLAKTLREWADSFSNEDAPEEPHNIYKRLEEATILERLAIDARPQDLTKLEKRFQKLHIDEIVEYLYFWIYNEYMRSGRFGDVVHSLEDTYQSDMLNVMPDLSLALNVMHTTGRMATDYAGLSPEELDKLSNLDEDEIARFAKKIGVKFKAVSKKDYDTIDEFIGYAGKNYYSKDYLMSKEMDDYWKDEMQALDLTDEDREGWARDKEREALDDGEPSMHFDEAKRLPPNTWLIHFTDSNPADVIKEGFKGRELEILGLTTHYKSGARPGPFALAYKFDDVQSNRDMFGKYGKNAILFQARQAAEAYHWSDEEDQVVFVADTAHNMFPIYGDSDSLELWDSKVKEMLLHCDRNQKCIDEMVQTVEKLVHAAIASSECPSGWIAPDGTFKKLKGDFEGEGHADAIISWKVFKPYLPENYQTMDYEDLAEAMELTARRIGEAGWIAAGRAGMAHFTLHEKTLKNRRSPAIQKMREIVEKYVTEPTFEVAIDSNNNKPGRVKLIHADTEAFIKHGLVKPGQR